MLLLVHGAAEAAGPLPIRRQRHAWLKQLALRVDTAGSGQHRARMGLLGMMGLHGRSVRNELLLRLLGLLRLLLLLLLMLLLLLSILLLLVLLLLLLLLLMLLLLLHVLHLRLHVHVAHVAVESEEQCGLSMLVRTDVRGGAGQRRVALGQHAVRRGGVLRSDTCRGHLHRRHVHRLRGCAHWHLLLLRRRQMRWNHQRGRVRAWLNHRRLHLLRLWKQLLLLLL